MMSTTPSSPADPAVPSSGSNVVTSSILVRNFGLWGQRATQGPVTILQHNRPRHVLVSIDQWNALIAAADAAGRPSSFPSAAILDVLSDLVIAADATGIITASSRTARMHFGQRCECGQPLEGIAVEDERAMMRDVVRRISASGEETIVHLAAGTHPDRMIRWVIVPQHGGVVLVGRDGPSTGR
jgi:hypothetical protein